MCDRTHDLCIEPSQLEACDGVSDDTPCEFTGRAGTCSAGVCLEQVCGDGILHAPEQCDGDALGDVVACGDLGYYNDAVVTCRPDCTYDRSACQGFCGDHLLQKGEACDAAAGVSVAGCDDPNIGFYRPGMVTCNAACQFDTTECSGRCGDGVVDTEEVCDGSEPPLGCLGYGYDHGVLACSNCGPAFRGCGTIGWRDESLALGGAAVRIAASAPLDLWVSEPGVTHHITDHVVRTFSLPNGFGGSVWARPGEVFVGGVGGVMRGTVQPDGDVVWSTATLANTTVVAIAGVGSELYAAGRTTGTNALSMLHFDGTTWSAMPAPVTTALPQALAVRAPTDIWLAANLGTTGTLYHWDGAAWTTVALPRGIVGTQALLNTVWVADNGHAWVGGDAGVGVWNGTDWEVTATPGRALAIHGASPTDVIVAGAGFVWRRDNGRWEDLSTSELHDTVWNSGSRLYTTSTGPGGRRLRFADGSAFLPRVSVGADVNDLWVGPTTAFAATIDDLKRREADGTWTTIYAATARVVSATGPTNVWIITNGGIERFDGTWYDETAALAAFGSTGPLDVWTSSPTEAWAIDGGAIYHWTNNAWTMTPTTHDLTTIEGASASNIWVATRTSVMLHFDGSGWTEVVVSGVSAPTDVQPLATGEVFAISSNVVARFDGALWHIDQVIPFGTLSSVWARSATDVFVSSSQGELVHFDGTYWRPVRVLVNAWQQLSGDSTHVYSGSSDGIEALYQHTPWPP